jgi:hypothetical protein
MATISGDHAKAARENGKKSRGPVTEKGKARSAANAIVHGLRAEYTVLASEEAEEFSQHVEEYLNALGCTTDDVEREAGVRIARLTWMIRRLDRMEQADLVEEAERRVVDCPEQKFVLLLEEAVRATSVMVQVIGAGVADREGLAALLDSVRTVVDGVKAVERECGGLSLGAEALAGAIGRVRLLSGREINKDAYDALRDRAAACVALVAARLDPAREALAQAKEKLGRCVPLPSGKSVALRDRYRRDYERRLRAEMELLGMIRERKAAVGSFGEAIQVKVRLVS